MASDKLRIIRVLNNIEHIFGIHRNFNEFNKVIKTLLILHAITLFTYSVCANIYFEQTIREVIVHDSEFIVWMSYFTLLGLEIFAIQFFAYYYSSNYIKLLDKLRELRSLFEKQKDKEDYYQSFLIIATIFYICLLMVDIFTIDYVVVDIVTTSAWHFGVIMHLLQVLTCLTINKKLTEIIICFNNILGDVNYEGNYDLPIFFESDFPNMNAGNDCVKVTDILTIYNEIILCCSTINKIFGIQLCFSYGGVFIFNFVTICGALLENTGVTLLQSIAYISIYLLTVIALIILAHSGECLKAAVRAIHCNMARIHNFWVKVDHPPKRLKYLLRLMKRQPPRLHACNVLHIRMKLVPAFFAFTATYTIVFLQFQKVL